MGIRYEQVLDARPKLNAFDYQTEAVEAIKNLEYGAIFHEQGLGKTKIAIDILLHWLANDVDTVLIVTKKTLVKNWIDEFAYHTSLKPAVLSSRRGDNYYVLNSPVRVIIANFEAVSGEKDRLSLFLRTRSVAIIIDESTKIKNPEAKLTQNFFELAPLFRRRVIMTGTPVANRPYDIWAQIFFLDFGKSLGSDFETFKLGSDLSNDLECNEEKARKFEHNISRIFTKISQFSVRETKSSGIISLPEKVYHNIGVPFEILQHDMYQKLRNELLIEVRRGNKTILDESPEAIKRLLRLIQITSNPRLIDESYECRSAKEIELERLLDDIVRRDEKAIVWSVFTDNIDYFTKQYKPLQAVKITGKMSVDERNRSVMAFKKGGSKVLFATPQSAKEGLTLTEANHAIFYDRGFNLDDYLQAQDRIHRISQTKQCHIYNLIVKDSIDEWIDTLLFAKQQAAFLSQGDISLAEYSERVDYSFAHIVQNILNISENESD